MQTQSKWMLKHKRTGALFPTYSYKNREAARKAAKGRRFRNEYTPVKIAAITGTPTRTIERPVGNTTPVTTTKANKTAEFATQAKAMCTKGKAIFPIAQSTAIHKMGKLFCR